MQEPTDDQLDGLFRKSGEEFDVPFDPAAWQDMKSRLDNNERYSAWEHALRWGLPILLLLLLTAGSWNAYYEHALPTAVDKRTVAPVGNGLRLRPSAKINTASNQTTNLTNPKNSRAQTEQPALDDTPTALAKPADRPAATLARPVNGMSPALAKNEIDAVTGTTTPPKTKNGSHPGTSTAIDRSAGPALHNPTLAVGIGTAALNPGGTTKSESSPATVSSPTKRSERSRLDLKRNRKRLADYMVAPELANTTRALPYPTSHYKTKPDRSFATRQPTLKAASKRVTNETVPVPTPQAITDVEKPVLQPLFAELTNRPAQWAKPLPFRGRSIEAPAEPTISQAEPTALAQPTPSLNGLSVRFMVSPDLSGIGLREIQRPGTNVGLMVEYRLAPRWVIQAGALRSTKVYKAYSSEYQWPSNWTSAVRPTSVDGSCKMFDIPVNLRYDLAIRPRSDGRLPDRWFVSGGATMYYMKQEDYVYSYPAHTYNAPKEWHGKTGWNGFSQLNLSGGFERSFSRRLSWQVEPFVKVPLKGIGFFKIDLLSTGAFFSLRYKL